MLSVSLRLVQATLDLYISSLMRFPSLPTIVRTFYTFTNATSNAIPAARTRLFAPLPRAIALKSMPTIPFLGSFFSSSSSQPKMSYPLQKSDDEWQAVLNKGMLGERRLDLTV